jgi:hypothetical protein
MNMKVSARGLGLGVIGAAILGTVLWITWPWTIQADRRATPATAPTPVEHPLEVTGAAGSETSDMLKMTRVAFLACGAPAPPSDVPDGSTATREQMVAAHATVRAFDEATTIYTQCLDTTAYQAGVQFKAVATDADAAAVSALQVQLHNAAIERDQALANRFNVQLRRFKARDQK